MKEDCSVHPPAGFSGGGLHGGRGYEKAANPAGGAPGRRHEKSEYK
jgi:hypothetical protein